MISRPRPGRRAAGVATVIGLAGACAILVVLASPAGTTARQRRPEAPPATPAGSEGLRLMREAAAACASVPFHGIQVTAARGAGGADTASVVDVWHQPGRAVLARLAGRSAEQQPAGGGQPQIMTITLPLLALMRQNYVISYAGPGVADGRPARLIEVRRRGGSLAARYWLDAATGLPLRRDLYDARARRFSEDAFVRLSLSAGQPVPAAGARPWGGRLGTAARAALRAGGWPLPRAVAGGLALFAATQAGTKSGKVVELSYSDGLSVVSVFLQRGRLPARLPGWQPATAAGQQVYTVDPDDQSLAWSAGGYVYTVIADAPASTVRAAVAGLRRGSAPPGFWDRMGRGLRRIASWAIR